MTIGIFDGVHLGHQQILRQLITGAHQSGALAVVLTFFPHPAEVLGGKKDFKYLTTPEERFHLLESLGIDVVITQNFDRAFANQTAADFMNHVVQFLGLRRLIIGYDTALGRGREGDAARLTEIGKKLNYEVQVIPALSDETGLISSTRIRADIALGNVSAAAGALGRYYSISGHVIHGDGRGHRISVPTANLAVPEGKVIPTNGIYACWAWVEPSHQKKAERPGLDVQPNKMMGSSDKNPRTPPPFFQSGTENYSPAPFGTHPQDGKKYLAAVNVGVRPTFTPDLPVPAIEAHLLDFTSDIYGQKLMLEFVDYLRPEEKFATVPSLVDQIRRDIDLTREILS
ncbi:MAG: bifunctional riboflavin kinase/FMN adenylyltransferase [Methanobacteriaceae archaeon]